MVFLDSGFLIALAHSGDANHADAMTWARTIEQNQTPLLTTEYNLVEVIDFFSSRGRRADGRNVVANVRDGRFITVTPCSTVLLERGIELHAARDDKTWSLSDCLSMVVMDDYRVRDVLTYDRDFWQAGYNVLSQLP